MDLDDVARLAVCVEPGEQLGEVVLQDVFQPVDAGGGEEGADGVTALAVLVVMDRGEDGLGRWMGLFSSQQDYDDIPQTSPKKINSLPVLV